MTTHLGSAAPAFEDLDAARARVAARLAGVERAILVMSGKGGVGKSAVAVNLALALARRGQRVGLLDADLQGPSVAKMLGLRGQPVRATTAGALRPAVGPQGVAVQSMDFFLQGAQALDWDGPQGEGALARSALEHAALGDLLGQTLWGELETLVVDLAPGADRLPAFASWLPRGARPAAACLAVTLPTEVAMLAVERSLRRAHEARIRVLGLVENMGRAVCASCGAEAPLFHEASAERLAHSLGVELLARIPFDRELAAAADAGRPFTAAPARSSATLSAFAHLAERVAGIDPDAQEDPTW